MNEEVFWGEQHAQVIVERWRRQYNEERPHSALGYRTPAEIAGQAEERPANLATRLGPCGARRIANGPPLLVAVR